MGDERIDGTDDTDGYHNNRQLIHGYENRLLLFLIDGLEKHSLHMEKYICYDTENQV